MLPKILYKMEKNKSQSIPMRSINLGSAAEVGELSDSLGISTRKFPYLTTRRGDVKQDGLDGVQAMTVFGGELVTMQNDGLHIGTDKVDGVNFDGKTFAPINSKLVVYSDDSKVYVEKSDTGWQAKGLEAEITVANATFSPSSIAITKSMNKIASGQGCKISGQEFTVNTIQQIYFGDVFVADMGQITMRKIFFLKSEKAFSNMIKFNNNTNNITFYDVWNGKKTNVPDLCDKNGITRNSVIYISTPGSYNRVYIVQDIQDNDIVVRYPDGSSPVFGGYSGECEFYLEDTNALKEFFGENVGKAVNIKSKSGDYKKFWLERASVGFEMRGNFKYLEIGLNQKDDVTLYSTGWEKNALSEIKTGDQLMLICNDNTSFPLEIEVSEVSGNQIIAKSNISESFIEIIPGEATEGTVTVLRISGENSTDLSLLKAGDAVNISGSANNDISFVINKISANAIYAQSQIFTAEEFNKTDQPFRISRKVPALDFICEKDNRLYGVSNAEKTIYVSALGDPTNMYAYDGVSTDSFAVAVGGEGDFTACCKYGESVIFFKEDKIYKLVGSYPAEFALYSYDVPGVARGSEKSCVIINEVLYYKGRYGVYAYTGGIPVLISECFGEKVFTDAVAGSDGRYYYLSVLDEEKKPYLFTYDTRTQLWLIEEKVRCVDFARTREGLHYAGEDGYVYKVGVEDASGEWLARWAPIYEIIEGKRSYSRILLRVSLPRGSYIIVKIRCDGREWREAGKIIGRTENVVPIRIPINRCDKFELELSGKGECTILDIMREFYVGSEV